MKVVYTALIVLTLGAFYFHFSNNNLKDQQNKSSIPNKKESTLKYTVSKSSPTKTGYAEKTINIRKRPSKDSQVLSRFKKGDSFTVFGTDGDWKMVYTSRGDTGYVFSTLIRYTKPQKPETKTSSIENELRQIAYRQYPDDKKMQDYIYQQQRTAYIYLQNENDNEVKAIAYTEYPDDYSMQKYVYDQQLSAKNYMARIGNESRLKRQAVREYPNDYSMQKYTYENLVSTMAN